MFSKFCEGKQVDNQPTNVDEPFPHQFDASRRVSVSAECWDQASDNQTPRCTQHPPSSGVKCNAQHPETCHRLEQTLRRTLLFKELSDDLMKQVLQALKFRKLRMNEQVITQGDEGNELFVLDKGRVQFIINGEVVGEAGNNSTFGELALMYNAPRAATVRCLEDSEVFSLDRITFKKIMVAKLSRKRLHSQKVLSQIDIFAHLPEPTQLKIADALQPVKFQNSDVIIKEGDSGSDFFLIDEGTVEVTCNGNHVTTLNKGSYFGELALIYDLPRAATVTASSYNLKLEVLSKSGFKRLIGPDLLNELRKRDPRNSNRT